MVVIGAVNETSGHIFIEVKLGDRNSKEHLAPYYFLYYLTLEQEFP